MRKAALVFTLGLAIAFSLSARRAQTHANPLLVSTTWLAEHLDDRPLVLIHVGQKEDYDAGHIPGAQLLTLRDISTPPGSGLRLELPPVDELRATFERIGILNTSRVVIYFGKDWVTPAARVYFTLDYLGLGGETSILDGGLLAWQAEGRPVTKNLSSVHPGSFTPHPNRSVVVDSSWIFANLKNDSVTVIDARLPEYYSGANAGSMPRAGHIPGAINIPFTSLVDDTNKLKDSAALRAMFKTMAVKPGTRIVAYCHIGQQASLVYFVAKCLGYEASLYDGSFEDWSVRRDLPVVISVPK